MATKRRIAFGGAEAQVSSYPAPSPRVVVGKSKEISTYLLQGPARRVLAVTFESERELLAAEEVYRRVGEILPQLIRSRQQARVDKVVEALLPEIPTSRSALIQARMQADAIAHILESGEYVPAIDIAKLAGYSQTNPNAPTSKWKREKAIFAVEKDGIDHFPLFALNPEKGYRPYPVVGEILNIFGDTRSSWALAFWFAGLNGFLDDQRPQDLLATKPELVVNAAKDAMAGLQHG